MAKETNISRFEEIMDEIKELVDEAFGIVKKELGRKDPNTVSLASAYWYEQIKGIVDGDGSMETMAETLSTLKDEDE